MNTEQIWVPASPLYLHPLHAPNWSAGPRFALVQAGLVAAAIGRKNISGQWVGYLEKSSTWLSPE